MIEGRTLQWQKKKTKRQWPTKLDT